VIVSPVYDDSKNTYYEVQKGDTLFYFEKYNILAADLKQKYI
jgi:hypothetical protein